MWHFGNAFICVDKKILYTNVLCGDVKVKKSKKEDEDLVLDDDDEEEEEEEDEEEIFTADELEEDHDERSGDEVLNMLREIECEPCEGPDTKPGCKVRKEYGCPPGKE
jgi:hypothetical protein